MTDESTEILPSEIVPNQVLGKEYEYSGLFDMLEDIERLRRKTGWEVFSTDADQYCIFTVTRRIGENVTFKIRLDRLKRVDWPRSYLGVDKIRNAFTRRTERQLIVKALNDLPQDIEATGPAKTLWERLKANELP